MKSIWKFPLPGMESMVKMPKGARILCVQMQGTEPTLWAEVDTVKKKEIRHFRIFGTGFELPRGMGRDDHYIGTVQQGALVWHVYEECGV